MVELDQDKLLKQVRAIPWKAVGIILSISFMLASIGSFLATYLFMPKLQQASESVRPASEDKINKLASATSLTESELKIIYDRNIFNKNGELGDYGKPEEGEEVASSKIVKSDLPVKLLGIIYGGTPFNGLATIQNTEKQNKINSFIVGDSLVRDAVVTEIHRTKVFLERNGRKEYLELDKAEIVRTARKKKAPTEVASAGGIAPIATGPAAKSFREEGFEREGNKMIMSDTFKQKLLSQENLSKVLQDAKATPNQVDGQIRGFRLTRIRENSIYSKAGFQNNDIVMEINGVPLNNAASAIRLLQGLKNESSIDVVVNRDGATVNLTLTVN